MGEFQSYTGGSGEVIYRLQGVPVNSVLLMRTREQALALPKGDIELVYYPESGFISNRLFEEEKVSYTSEYEETQGFSQTFSAFHKRLAEDLIDRYDLRKKQVIEIGCGKGEFLTLLCELGPNQGVGFDPAYHPQRNESSAKDRIEFVRDFYSEKYGSYKGDFVCCKMTLEHIPDVASFVGTVRRSIGDDGESTIVFFQVPEVSRILKDLGFWDIYYEHCSYFNTDSLAHLFRNQGFEVLNTWTDYDDQYLMIEAKPSKPAQVSTELDFESLKQDVDYFTSNIDERLSGWRKLLQSFNADGKRVALWGGGSKAVAFLTTLGIEEEVAFAVDINPYKHGTFLAGTGHEIVGPSALTANPADLVIIMNPIYHDEIKADLGKMGMHPEILHVDMNPSVSVIE